MYTEAESRRWASQMLMSALRGNLSPEEVTRQVTLAFRLHGAAGLEKLLNDVLTEAGRIGPGHCDGSLYCSQKITLTRTLTREASHVRQR
ncbi:hypothetical protein [[Erwinia] mediterraneensis]|uniref:hypothetical protein n=1 Tax=[Erwinia] mediterraneensis TaxID=2161819 RepID=UPI001A9256DF|nr:hypothetical protein [[Erwinia] mediterraneensis]